MYKQKKTSQKLCYVKAKMLLKKTQILLSVVTVKPRLQKFQRVKPHGLLNRINRPPFRHDSRTPGCEKLS